MKRLGKVILAVILIAGGVCLYRCMTGPSQACQAYQRFADLMAFRMYAKAKALTTGPAAEDMEEKERSGEMGRAQDLAQVVNRTAGDISGISYNIESETTADNRNKVRLVAVQLVCRHSGSAMTGATNFKYRHEAEMQREPSGWKVYSFKEERVGNNPPPGERENGK